MGVYVHFTDEQKYRANNVDLADFLQRRGEKLLPSGRDKRLASATTASPSGETSGTITPQRAAGMPLISCGSSTDARIPKP